MMSSAPQPTEVHMQPPPTKPQCQPSQKALQRLWEKGLRDSTAAAKRAADALWGESSAETSRALFAALQGLSCLPLPSLPPHKESCDALNEALGPALAHVYALEQDDVIAAVVSGWQVLARWIVTGSSEHAEIPSSLPTGSTAVKAMHISQKHSATRFAAQVAAGRVLGRMLAHLTTHLAAFAQLTGINPLLPIEHSDASSSHGNSFSPAVTATAAIVAAVVWPNADYLQGVMEDGKEAQVYSLGSDGNDYGAAQLYTRVSLALAELGSTATMQSTLQCSTLANPPPAFDFECDEASVLVGAEDPVPASIADGTSNDPALPDAGRQPALSPPPQYVQCFLLFVWALQQPCLSGVARVHAGWHEARDGRAVAALLGHWFTAVGHGTPAQLHACALAAFRGLLIPQPVVVQPGANLSLVDTTITNVVAPAGRKPDTAVVPNRATVLSAAGGEAEAASSWRRTQQEQRQEWLRDVDGFGSCRRVLSTLARVPSWPSPSAALVALLAMTGGNVDKGRGAVAGTAKSLCALHT
jgi:hypothetical protein